MGVPKDGRSMRLGRRFGTVLSRKPFPIRMGARIGPLLAWT
jgi:hypothetical protein